MEVTSSESSDRDRVYIMNPDQVQVSGNLWWHFSGTFCTCPLKVFLAIQMKTHK